MRGQRCVNRSLAGTAQPDYFAAMTKISIDIVSDAVCPWCFVGKRRLERALASAPPDLEFKIGWRPYQLNPDMPRGGMDRQRYLEVKFGGEARAERIYRTIMEAGASEGIEFDFSAIARTPNTIDAHRLIDRGGRHGVQDAVVEKLFGAYFAQGRDIGDLDVLAAIGAEEGLDRDETRRYLESSQDVERIRQEDEIARKMGIQAVPTFIFNRKYAVPGAQDPPVFLEVFGKIGREMENGAAAPASA